MRAAHVELCPDIASERLPVVRPASDKPVLPDGAVVIKKLSMLRRACAGGGTTGACTVQRTESSALSAPTVTVSVPEYSPGVSSAAASAQR